MKRFSRAEMLTFLHALDRNLKKPVSLVMVGGAAASLGYRAGVVTNDLDVFVVRSGSAADIGWAAQVARDETGLLVQVASAAIAELPYNYEDRLGPIRDLRLDKLSIVIPDKYDLTLSKTMRAYKHDVDAIEGIHRNHRMSMKTLLERFENEFVKQVVGDEATVRFNMVMVISRLWGPATARKVARGWNVPEPSAR